MKRALAVCILAAAFAGCVPAKPRPAERNVIRRPPARPLPPTATPATAALQPAAVETPSGESPPEDSTAPLEPAPVPRFESVLAAITPATPPRLATSLRLTEDGRQRLERGDFQPAIDSFEQAVKVDASNPHAYYWLAQVHYRRGRFDQAIAFADKAAVLFARTDSAWLSQTHTFRAGILEQIGRFAEARAAYKLAVQAAPGNVAAQAGAARLGGAGAP